MLVCRRVVKQGQADSELSPQISGETPEVLSAGPAAGGPVFFPRRDPSPLAERLLAELSHEGEGDSSLVL